MLIAATGAPTERSASSARWELPHAAKLGVPFMKSATGSFSTMSWICSLSSAIRGSPRRDAKLVDGAVAQRVRERLVDEAVLLEERDPLEARAHDGHVEVVAAAGAVDDVDGLGVGERLAEQGLEPVDAFHRLDGTGATLCKASVKPQRPVGCVR